MPELTEANTGTPNDPGWYKDPQSGVVQHVAHPAAADALVRLGWQQLQGGPDPIKDHAGGVKFEKANTGAVIQAPLQPVEEVKPSSPELVAQEEAETPAESASEQPESATEPAQVSEVDTQEGEDNYKETKLDDGSTRYFKNGVRISQEEYNQATGSTQ